MNCSQCKQELVAYAEGLLDPRVHEEVAAHLRACAPCRAEADVQQRLRDRLTRDAAAEAETSLELPVMGRIVREQTFKLRRNAMRKRYGQVGMGMAAAAAIAAVLWLPTWGGSTSGRATAAEVLAQAVAALTDLHSVYIRLSVRTYPGDNFEGIALEQDFVPHEMWKQFGPTPKWRVEKPGRVVVMDGESSLLWINKHEPGMAAEGGVDTGFVGWLLPLMDVDKVLDSELKMAGRLTCSRLRYEDNSEGDAKIVVTVEAKAQGDFTNDWLKNKSISGSDNRRVYTFDAETKRLEDLEVWVQAEEEDVLVLEIDEIVYNPGLERDLFTLALPEDVAWFERPEAPVDGADIAKESPAEAARAFFQALTDRDWKRVGQYWMLSRLPEGFKQGFGGLEIISIGEPFQSGQYPGWFVPYEIALKSGEVRKHNLAVRNDNPAGQYVVDGGF